MTRHLARRQYERQQAELLDYGYCVLCAALFCTLVLGAVVLHAWVSVAAG